MTITTTVKTKEQVIHGLREFMLKRAKGEEVSLNFAEVVIGNALDYLNLTK